MITNNVLLTNNDLLNGSYDISVLEENIDSLDLRYLLKYQKLNAYFCVKYLLDPNDQYAACVEETYIDIYDVLHYQSHIPENELLEELKTQHKIIISLTDSKKKR
jgi:hypothetical protein